MALQLILLYYMCMAEVPKLTQELLGGERPAWSVMQGKFDSEAVIINPPLVSLMARKYWYANPTSEGRRNLQAIELVFKSYELCGINISRIEEKITDTAKSLKEYSKQVTTLANTPELVKVHEDHEGKIIDIDEDVSPNPSPVMEALRVLIEKTNETEMIIVDDKQVLDNERWSVGDRTKRMARAILCDIYRQEYPRIPAVDVE